MACQGLDVGGAVEQLARSGLQQVYRESIYNIIILYYIM
jgi:hypothetical protein